MSDTDRSQSPDELKVLLPYLIPYFLLWPFQYFNTLSPNAMYVTCPVKYIVIAVTLIGLRKHFTELRCKCSFHGVWVGMVALAIWIIPWWKLIPGLPAPNMATGGFNPLQFNDNALPMFGLIAFRLAGAVLVIPFVEELLFRSCIARWIIQSDFRTIPIGSFTWPSLWMTTLLFAAGHRPWEWLPSVLVGLLYYWLAVWRKNILDCIVAHGVTNLALGIYVLTTHQWFWW